jgi:hypothetical protein
VIVTARDEEGLERLKDQITADAEHKGYHVKCFSEDEARWIKERLIEWRSDLVGGVTFSWLTFRRIRASAQEQR